MQADLEALATVMAGTNKKQADSELGSNQSTGTDMVGAIPALLIGSKNQAPGESERGRRRFLGDAEGSDAPPKRQRSEGTPTNSPKKRDGDPIDKSEGPEISRHYREKNQRLKQEAAWNKRIQECEQEKKEAERKLQECKGVNARLHKANSDHEVQIQFLQNQYKFLQNQCQFLLDQNQKLESRNQKLENKNDRLEERLLANMPEQQRTPQGQTFGTDDEHDHGKKKRTRPPP